MLLFCFFVCGIFLCSAHGFDITTSEQLDGSSATLSEFTAGNTEEVNDDVGADVVTSESAFDRCSSAMNPCQPDEICRIERSVVMCLKSHCLPNPCANGDCVETPNSYRCICHQGFSGDNCKKPNVCYPNPCAGDCECKESCRHEWGYYCESRGGYMGKNCTIPMPRVRCEARSILVDITLELYEELDKGMKNTYLFVSTDSVTKSGGCEANKVEDGYQVELLLPFSSCGTKAVRSNEAAVFKNRLYVNRRVQSIPGLNMAFPLLDFQCSYEKEYNFVTSVEPVVSRPVSMNRAGGFLPVIELCKVSACAAGCPRRHRLNEGAVYVAGETIFMGAYIQTGTSDSVTTIHSITLTCGSQDPSELDIIEEGCPVTSDMLVHSSAGARACASFPTPRALNCDEVYMRVLLRLCSADGVRPCKGSIMPQRCVSTGRDRRSVSEEEVLVEVGPLVFLSGSAGFGKAVLYPDSNEKPRGVGANDLGEVVAEGLEGLAVSAVESVAEHYFKGVKSPTSSRYTPKNDENVTALAILVPSASLLFFCLLLFLAWFRTTPSLRHRFAGGGHLVSGCELDLRKKLLHHSGSMARRAKCVCEKQRLSGFCGRSSDSLATGLCQCGCARYRCNCDCDGSAPCDCVPKTPVV